MKWINEQNIPYSLNFKIIYFFYLFTSGQDVLDMFLFFLSS